jgi:aspartate-semialdehyde dehydrogenase
MVSVHMSFNQPPSREEFINAVCHYKNPIDGLDLPSAPIPFMTFFEQENRPQTAQDRDIQKGMGIGVGRLREDNIFDWKFITLSHNTIRGAAGGSLLTAELLAKKGYLN